MDAAESLCHHLRPVVAAAELAESEYFAAKAAAYPPLPTLPPRLSSPPPPPPPPPPGEIPPVSLGRTDTCKLMAFGSAPATSMRFTTASARSTPTTGSTRSAAAVAHAKGWLCSASAAAAVGEYAVGTGLEAEAAAPPTDACRPGVQTSAPRSSSLTARSMPTSICSSHCAHAAPCRAANSAVYSHGSRAAPPRAARSGL
mmetsp:Transcript_30971/g.77542  ORF Transcript_30971/g.77542 Transcript_30971/m.77542 type:complete len:200 (+) Transcript_30971:3643-4242(+)